MIRSFVKSLKSPTAQGRISEGQPIAVLDIGSNSVRLVIYERHIRALTPIYNEKVACGLGRGVGQTGALAEESVERALIAMRRFALVCQLTKVGDLHILATAATRDASNGAMFIAGVEEIMNTNVRILTGEEEAYFAALGTIAGMPQQQGMLGDFGGGSLELAILDGVLPGDGETHPLGAIRLQDDSERSASKAYKIARKTLASSPIMERVQHSEFVAIGGTWRALAKVHQIQTAYPLSMVQGYRVDADKMIDMCSQIIELADKGEWPEAAQRLSSNRKDLLSFGAAALNAVLEVGKFKTVKFSALGVREGYLFGQLDSAEQEVDPLLQACEELSILRSRSPSHAHELIEFTNRFVAAMNYDENQVLQQLRYAACYLSDISWRGHPDYRGVQAVDAVAYGSFVGIDHTGRAHLARCLAVRYLGLKRKHLDNDDLFEMCSQKSARHADTLGALFRVAYLLSAAMPNVLPLVEWERVGDKLQLLLPAGYEVLAAEKMLRRLNQLAAFLELEAEVIVR
ncbi:Ppx/GppA phosphatase family protein [uncultured Maritalea sp.]|uniref:Ppx/GppA phosphatase family protein n=1 Tax=uncultured Maritalea sp. TaxID=757249 RepID=UPI00262ED313|nr:Ppx/GppA phosphatase family protein [uncultured Maritalea sp.]